MARFARSALFSIISPAFAAIAILLFVGFRYREPLWMLEPETRLIGLGFGIAFVVSLILLKSNILRTDHVVGRLFRLGAIGSLVCLPLTVIFLITKVEIRILTLVSELALLFGLLLVNNLSIPKIAILVVNLCVFAIAVQPSFSEMSRNSLKEIIAGDAVEVDESVEFVISSLYDVKVTDYTILGQYTRVSGGALDVIDENRLLLATGDGELYVVWLGENTVSIEGKHAKTPLDRNLYVNSVENPSPYFRVTDALLEGGHAKDRMLYVSHHHWDSQDNCITLRVSETSVDFDALGTTELEWHNRFTSTPCLTSDTLHNTTGGRMAFRSPFSVLLSVGETRSHWLNLVADEETSYGKIIEIDRRDWSARWFTKGHRNPQGLLVDGEQIWATEHGPQGGDELNRIEEGEDYGWPQATYGTAYGQKRWPRSDTPGDHPVGRRPVYAWVPSIGVSNLILIEGSAFPAWKGDLMVSSLDGSLGAGRSLFRVKVDDARAVVVERIKTGRTIRDLIEMPDGRLVLWDGVNTIQVVEPADHIFSECIGCHALRRGTHGIGPGLWDIVGRPVAGQRDFQYSRALKEFGGRWSKGRLDAFLRDPSNTVPGTTMEFPGVEDVEERRAVIEYLEKLPD